jgi:beta-glucanase (GH16 family)
VRARMTVTARSMAAWWLVGFEDRPERSAELCVAEVFGDAVRVGDDGRAGAAVGMGAHPFRDPRVVEDFAAPRLAIDVADLHTYAVDWRPDGAVFSVDGDPVRSVAVTPDYPMQSMLAVFDFPDRAVPGEPYVVPELVVDVVRGYR